MINPLETRFFIFRCVFVVNIIGGELILAKCSGYVGYDTKKQLTRLFHALLNKLFHARQTRRGGDFCNLGVLLVQIVLGA